MSYRTKVRSSCVCRMLFPRSRKNFIFELKISLQMSYSFNQLIDHNMKKQIALIETENNHRTIDIEDIEHDFFLPVHLFTVFVISVGYQISIIAGYSLTNPFSLVLFLQYVVLYLYHSICGLSSNTRKKRNQILICIVQDHVKNFLFLVCGFIFHK